MYNVNIFLDNEITFGTKTPDEDDIKAIHVALTSVLFTTLRQQLQLTAMQKPRDAL